MIKTRVKIAMISMATSFSFSSHALLPASECHPLKIYFGNGILTERISGFFDADRLDQWLRPRIPASSSEHISFDLAYNPTEGLWGDLIEAYDQKLREPFPEKWSKFFPVVAGSVIIRGLESFLENYFDTTGGRILDAAARRLNSPRLFDDKTVQNHVTSYAKAMRAGQRVLVISHSQGNLYANAAFNYMMTRQLAGTNLASFGVAAIASPASIVATGDHHVNSATDLVIQSVTALGLLGLPPNDTSVPVFPPEDRLGHGFRSIYFNSKYPIRQHVQISILGTLMRVME